MPENTLVKMKTGTIEDLQSKTENQPDVPLDEGSVYFAVDTENHIGQIVYDAPDGVGGVDRIVMSSYAEHADTADSASTALTAGRANLLSSPAGIDGVEFDGSGSIIHYVECDTAGNVVTDEDVKVGDIVLIVETEVPDRWVQSIDTTNHTITFYKLETSKIDLNNYVDLTSAQTISGNKTFSGTLYALGNISDGINSVAVADIADKDYVDDAIGDIDTALQNLVSGNGVI